MATAGSIVIDLLMKTGAFETDTARAESIAKRRAQAIDRAFSEMGTRIAVGASAAGTALVAMIGSTANTAKEIGNLAQLSGASATEFQRFAAAAKSVGVQQDQLGDIFKDFREKIGEFVSTGGGEMKDFFEQIAPKVGVTAEAFRNLSGPQALQLYFDSLQKAGLSTEQMSFYLESAANDATKLIPLLRDGGQELKTLGDEAERMGIIMDEKAIASAKEFSKNLDTMQSLLNGVKIAISKEVIPIINALSQEFLVGIKHAGSFGDALRLFGTINPFRDVGGNIKAISSEIESLTAARERYVRSGSDTSSIDTALAAERKRLEYLKEVQRMQALASVGNDVSDAISRRMTNVPLPGAAWKPPETGKKGKPAAKDDYQPLAEAAKEYGRVLSDLNTRQVELSASGVDYTRTQQELLQLFQSPEWLQMPDDWKRIIVEQAEGVIQLEQYSAEQQRLRELLGHDKLDQQRKDLELLNKEFFEGRLEMADWEAASARVLGVTGEAAQEVKGLAADLGMTFSSAFEDAMVSGKGLSDVLRGLEQDLIRLLMRQMVTQPLANLITSSIGPLFGASGDGAGTSVNSYVGARAAGGPVSQGQPYLVGELGTELFIPNTSGVIVSNSRLGAGGSGPSGGLGSGTQVSVVVNNHAGRDTQATATSRTDAMGNTVIDVLVERVEAGMMGRVSRGTGMAPLLERRYGLNPAMGAMR